jgi:hypothetical protein
MIIFQKKKKKKTKAYYSENLAKIVTEWKVVSYSVIL